MGDEMINNLLVPRSNGGVVLGMLLVAAIVWAMSWVAAGFLTPSLLALLSAGFLLLFFVVPPLLPRSSGPLTAPVSGTTVAWTYGASIVCGLTALPITLGTSSGRAAALIAALVAIAALAYALASSVRHVRQRGKKKGND